MSSSVLSVAVVGDGAARPDVERGGPPVSGLARALGILNHIAELSPSATGISAVARALGLSKSVTHRMLKELQEHDYLVFDDVTKLYRLGPQALVIGLAALRGLHVPEVAIPHLERLVDRFGETATLSQRTPRGRMYIHQVLSPREIRMSVTMGLEYPLYAGSSSKAILACLDDATVDACVAQASRGHDLVQGTPLTDESLRRDLEEIRARGYAQSTGERQSGSGSVAAPLRQWGGEVFGSISLCGPVSRFTPGLFAEYGQAINETARTISGELGYEGPLFR